MQNNSIKKGLTIPTADVIDKIAKLECIKELYLCGGTAQAIQMFHRKSEDLDFELIGIRKERPNLDISGILNEISQMFPNTKRNIMANDHFEIYLENNVKLSFFRPNNNVPYINPGLTYGNIKTVSLQDLLGMKLYTITQRNTFRDYYDIYALLKDGYSLAEGIRYACALSKHEIHSKNIYSTLLSERLFEKKENFSLMSPKYDVTPEEICSYIQNIITQEKELGQAAFLKIPEPGRTIDVQDEEDLNAIGITTEQQNELKNKGILNVNKKGISYLVIKNDKVAIVINAKTTMPLHDAMIKSGTLTIDNEISKTKSKEIKP